MRYSKSLDLVISALVYARNGKIEQAAALFDKAVNATDVLPTIARLEKVQATAFNADFSRNKTTAQLMREIAAKKAKAKAKPKAPVKGKKKAKAKMRKERAMDDGFGVGDDFDQITDDMTVSNGEADDDSVLNGNPGGVSFADEDDGMEDFGDEGDDEFIEDMDDDVAELPEAAVDEESDLEPLNDLEVADLDDLDDMDFGDGSDGDDVVDEFETLPDDEAFDATAETDDDEEDDEDKDEDEDKEAEAQATARVRQRRRMEKAELMARQFRARVQAKAKAKTKAVATKSPQPKKVVSNSVNRMARVTANLKALASLKKQTR